MSVNCDLLMWSDFWIQEIMSKFAKEIKGKFFLLSPFDSKKYRQGFKTIKSKKKYVYYKLHQLYIIS